LGVAVSGAILGSAATRDAFTTAEHAVWWLVLGLGVGILLLGLVSTSRAARQTADRVDS
jgi:hypothetical protein